MRILAEAAISVPNASIETWLVPGAKHAQAFHTEGEACVERLVSFYTSVLGPDSDIS
jgi:hypothetical protein